jgi:hypothetical protein
LTAPVSVSGPPKAERAVYQVDTDCVLAKAAQLADPDFDGAHGREYAELELAAEEQVVGLDLDQRMQPGSAQERRADRDPADRLSANQHRIV